MTGWDDRSGGSADIDQRAVIGDGTSVWHLAQIREHASIGANCVIGRGAYIGPGVVVGDNCKIQNLKLTNFVHAKICNLRLLLYIVWLASALCVLTIVLGLHLFHQLLSY